MFQRTLTKFGSDGGRVDLILEQDHYQLGDLVTGEIHVYGGNNPCKVRSVDVFFIMNVMVGDEQKERTIMAIPCESSFWIEPNERKLFPFTFQIPRDLLVSSETVSYYFMTELELADRNRYKDRDEITIHAPERVQLLLHAFQQLGFQEHSHSRQFNGYEQEFLLFPSILFRDQIREVRLTVALEENGLQASFLLCLYDQVEEVTETIWIEGSLLEQLTYHHELEKHFLRWMVPQERPSRVQPEPTKEKTDLVIPVYSSDSKIEEMNPKKATYTLYESIPLDDDDETELLIETTKPIYSDDLSTTPEPVRPHSYHSHSTPLEEVQKVVVTEGKRLVGAIGALAAELFNEAVDRFEEHRAKRDPSTFDTLSDSSLEIPTLHSNSRLKKVDFLDEQKKGLSIIYMEDDDD